MAFNNWGYALNKLGKYEEAIEKLEIAIKINPKYDRPYNHLGVALTGLGEYKDAIEKFEISIALNAKRDDVYLNWGEALRKLKESQPELYATEVEEFKKVLEANKEIKELKESEDFQKIYQEFMK